MKRSHYPFPFNDFLPMDFVKRAWEDGWLDEFADNHFLIMPLKTILITLTGSISLFPILQWTFSLP